METLQINYDNLKKDSWSEKEDQNVRMLIDFVQLIMNNHEFEKVREKYGNALYTQHNRNIPDGFDALIEYVRGFVKRYPDYTYDVKQIHSDGDYVVFHSQITTHKKDRGNDRKGINVIDTWRIEDGKIAEHWDSLQPMSGFLRFLFWIIGGRVANKNGVY